MYIETYYDREHENRATITKHEILPYKGATKTGEAYKLTLSALYQDDFIYHVSVYETKSEALDKMNKCGTWAYIDTKF